MHVGHVVSLHRRRAPHSGWCLACLQLSDATRELQADVTTMQEGAETLSSELQSRLEAVSQEAAAELQKVEQSLAALQSQLPEAINEAKSELREELAPRLTEVEVRLHAEPRAQSAVLHS